MYSVYSKETQTHLSTGLNSSTRKEAINDAIDLLAIDSTSPSRLKRMSLKDKENYLNYFEYVIEEHEQPIEEGEGE